MNIMVQKLRLIAIRAELGLDQKELADEASLSQALVSRAESGVAITENSALRLFYAINRLRASRDLPDLAFDEIAWRLAP